MERMGSLHYPYTSMERYLRLSLSKSMGIPEGSKAVDMVYVNMLKLSKMPVYLYQHVNMYAMLGTKCFVREPFKIEMSGYGFPAQN